LRYMLLIYQNPITWQGLPEPARQALMNEAGVVVKNWSRPASGRAAMGLPTRYCHVGSGSRRRARCNRRSLRRG